MQSNTTPQRRASDLLAPHVAVARRTLPWWPIWGLPVTLLIWGLL